MRKRRFRVTTVMLSFFCLGAFLLLEGFAWVPGYKEARPIVIDVPPAAAQDPGNPLLDYFPHVSLVDRPEETFAFPIAMGEVGPVQPLFAGKNTYPFICELDKGGLMQPVVDNDKGWGIPVYAENEDGTLTDRIIGYSKDCLIPRHVQYFYKVKGEDQIKPWDDWVTDADTLEINGETQPYVIRVEVGSINRYVYLLAMIKGAKDKKDRPDTSNWNKKLVYQFRGGVGIGYRQGRVKIAKILKRRLAEFEKGYAMAYSSGTHTRNHYDILLSEDITLRVKKQFETVYGKPEYTVGVGGSGGGLQQYLLSQNHPGIIDAAIPQYSYSDMVTQITYALDCELLEHYFDVKDKDNPKWADWNERQKIEGMNAENGAKGKADAYVPFAHLYEGNWPSVPSGSSECVNGFRGLTALVANPAFTYFFDEVSSKVFKKTKWSYWDNMSHIFGQDDAGYALRTWDNVGVQYGLNALVNNDITPQEFLDLNARVGGWKAPRDMRNEKYNLLWGGELPIWWSVWGNHNTLTSPDNGKTPAPRTSGDIEAMEAAYRSGQVFLGKATLPIIDVRHYLEDKLDMHHVSASFASRLRMQKAQGYFDNQAIWIGKEDYDPTVVAFDVIDEWMTNIKNNPEKSVVENKPEAAQDSCFDSRGELLFAGDTVWDGEWNNKPIGRCTGVYPHYSSTRIVAGADYAGDVMKCNLKSVDDAIASGMYGMKNMEVYRNRLHQIFPEGVCDYSKADVGLPQDLKQALSAPDQLETDTAVYGPFLRDFL